MRWRWAGRGVGVVLLVSASVALTLQVQVADGSRACGSAWDVVAGRVGWEQWWAEDLDQPARAADLSLVRTLDCPSAVNAHVVVAGVLATAGATAIVVGEVFGRGSGARAAREDPARSLRRLGVTAVAAGTVATAGGLVGLALLLADAESALYLYVDRSVAALLGLVLLMVPIGLLVAGWAAVLTGRALEHPDGTDGAA